MSGEELQGLTIRQYYGTSKLESPLSSDSAAYLRIWAREEVAEMGRRERRLPDPLMQRPVASYARWYASLTAEAQVSEQRHYGLSEDELLGRK